MRSVKDIIRSIDERDLRELAECICKDHDCTLDEMCARAPAGRMANPVQVTARRARNEMWLTMIDTLGFSLPRVAAMFGVHHTTVLYGARLAKGLPGKNVERRLRQVGAPLVIHSDNGRAFVPRKQVAR